MLGILGFFFIVILLILVMGVSILSRVIRFVFGFGKKSTTQQRQQQTYHSAQGKQQESKKASKGANKGKIFSKDEGEYVEFEEIKE